MCPVIKRGGLSEEEGRVAGQEKERDLAGAK